MEIERGLERFWWRRDEYTWTYKSEMAKTDIVMQYKDSFLAIFDLLIRREVWGRKIKKRKGIMNEIDD